MPKTSVTTEEYKLEVMGIPVEVVRKNIKNLHLAVYPPDGRVRVAAPLHLNQDAVRLAIISRIGWIRKKQDAFRNQARQSRREMVTGESHYFQGRRYRLKVVEINRPPTVKLSNNSTIELRVRPGSDRAKREAVLYSWYRKKLKGQIPAVINKWEPIIGVKIADWGVRKMKTRWGSCNRIAGRIWLNLELAKKSPSCLEYVVVHEMLHLVERHHNDRFKELISDPLPSWQTTRDELNRSPIGLL